MGKRGIVSIAGREMHLKHQVRKHLRALGFTKDKNGDLLPPSLSKDSYRALHNHQREERLGQNADFIRKNSAALLMHFASGKEVVPDKIAPRLELVKSDSWQSDLFRFASLCWRIPVSQGYGRRMRFLVWDDHNVRLMGIFALGDAVFNLKARDELIGWDHHTRSKALVHLMDAYVLGAVPPYNSLLCGKLIACLVRSKEVVKAFHAKYKKSVGIISKENKDPRLVVVTTSSALGRSSIYNRLKLDGKTYFAPIGYTTGWGHFHIPDDLFEEMRSYLRAKKDVYSGNFKYGQGPNWRLRTIRKVLTLLGLNSHLTKHGLQREVFLCEFAENAKAFLRGDTRTPKFTDLLSADDIAQKALHRWVLPRAERRSEYLQWDAAALMEYLTVTVSESPKEQSLKNVRSAR